MSSSWGYYFKVLGNLEWLYRYSFFFVAAAYCESPHVVLYSDSHSTKLTSHGEKVTL